MTDGQSVGDFFVNIIPRLDDIALNTGITALSNLGTFGEKAYGGLKKVVLGIDSTAEAMFNLLRVSQQLSIQPTKLDAFRKSLNLLGVESNNAYNALSTLYRLKGGEHFGEVIEEALMKAGIMAGSIPNDPMAAMSYIRQRYRATSNVNVRKTLEGFLPGIEGSFNASDVYFNRAMQEGMRTASPNSYFSNLESYKYAKGQSQNTIESVMFKLTNDSMPMLIGALSRLTDVVSRPEFQESVVTIADWMIKISTYLVEGIGGLAGLTKIGELQKERQKQYELTRQKSDREYSEKYLGGRAFGTYVPRRSGYVAQPQPVQVNIQTTSDGSYTDVKVKEQNKKDIIVNYNNPKAGLD